jgi:hypothetical protein
MARVVSWQLEAEVRAARALLTNYAGEKNGGVGKRDEGECAWFDNHIRVTVVVASCI